MLSLMANKLDTALQKLDNSVAGYMEKHRYTNSSVKSNIGVIKKKANIWSRQIIKVAGAIIDNKPIQNKVYRQHEKIAHRDLMISLTALSVAVTGTLVFPPLAVVSVIPMLYLVMPLFKQSILKIKDGSFSNAAILDTTLWIGALYLQFYIVGSIVLCFSAVSKKLILKTKDQSESKLFEIFGEKPNNVWIFVDEVEVCVPFEDIKKNDILIVESGETIAVDGVVIRGMSLVDQHKLTGESQPLEKEVGDTVYASSTVLSGKIYIKTQKAGIEVAAAQIREVLLKTVSYTSNQQSRGERISDQAVTPTLVLGAIIAPLFGLHAALVVLTLSFGYYMRIFGPLNVLTYLQSISDCGILIKDGCTLEDLYRIDTVIFDKTGTLTLEQPSIGDIYLNSDYDEDALIMYTAAAEHKQCHPIAKAILHEARLRKIIIPAIDDASYEIGYGIKAQVSNKSILVGSLRFMDLEKIDVPQNIRDLVDDRSLLMVAINQKFVGGIELCTNIRSGVKKTIEYLHQSNITTYIISGDQENTTRKLANGLGIHNYFAETLPQNKAEIVKELQQQGKNVCFIGDGINDTIALKQANISISLCGASSIAQDTAQIIFNDPDIGKLRLLLEISKDFEKRMAQSFKISITPGFITLPALMFFNINLLGAAVINQSSLLIGLLHSTVPVESKDKEICKKLSKISS
ncbi:heavy metal translocating P-type ATPase [Candidatus Uabimicrobium sp. HlEnr_7]|uniref:heavy metal translocating P-type ATPase n=1 Tax=Candidatus Uabimicrobium helgolandensis TaxID=3095367 RepID=UPI0035579BFA